MAESVISVENINKTYGTYRALTNLSFGVNRGECLALLGPNGAGKTTMMKIIYGRATRDSDSGTMNVFGWDPAVNELQIKYLSGIVQQENNIDEELNVRQNLEIYAKFYSIPAKEAGARIDELLDFMELTEKKNSPVRELSGGMQRRLIIARALLNNPKLLILDEPTTGLDPQVRHLIWNKIRILKREGTTVLLTTHYMEEAFNLADSVIILFLGRQAASGNPRTLLEQNIENNVLEIHNPQTANSAKQQLGRYQVRVDETHDTLFIFSDSFEALESVASSLMPGTYYLRQTNLEDLFLKLTGRQLRETQ